MKTVTNWEGNISCEAAVVLEPKSVEQLRQLLSAAEIKQLPTPIRPMGSRHSTTPCWTAAGGTLVDMDELHQIHEPEFDEETGSILITAEAGALYIDIARKLQEDDLQLYVNTEIGNMTIGSAACCGTKESFFPIPFGDLDYEYSQVSSYVRSVKLIDCEGKDRKIDDPEQLYMIRSSYGLFGVIYEVTLQVKPLCAFSLRHVNYDLDDFVRRFREIAEEAKQKQQSLMFYYFPFLDKISVEQRIYIPDAEVPRHQSLDFRIRNKIWASGSPRLANWVSSVPPMRFLKRRFFDASDKVLHRLIPLLLRERRVNPLDQMIEYSEKPGRSKYTFSIWAYPIDKFPTALKAYFDFCKKHEKETKYRTKTLDVGYWVPKDASALLSYSHDTDMISIDPVSIGAKGWNKFLNAHNEFAVQHNAKPLLNQSAHLTREQVERAFGERWTEFKNERRQWDPKNVFLNDYFRELLGEETG